MGHSLSFQALPEESRLFARLETEPKLATLATQFFNCGGGPYTWSSLEDLEEILEGVTEDMPALFASRAEVERVFAELVREFEEARAAHPGLEERRAFLEKTQWDISERLTRRLRAGRETDQDEFVQAVLFGAELLTPPGVRGPLGDGLRVVRRANVAEAARVLRAVAPGSLFDKDDEDWLYADFQSWRDMYLAAAKNGEVVVVGD
jgi:hypothetical protein